MKCQHKKKVILVSFDFWKSHFGTEGNAVYKMCMECNGVFWSGDTPVWDLAMMKENLNRSAIIYPR